MNIRLETSGDGIGIVTLNRPEKLNALSNALSQELVETLERVAADTAVRGVVITGAGRAFSAGGDVEGMQRHTSSGNWDEIRDLLHAGARVASLLHTMAKPTVAAINGPAVGAGGSLALACDLRIATPAASFGLVFSRLGLHPDWGGTYFLPRMIGASKALELILSGDIVDASAALRLGIFNRIVAGEELDAAAREAATTLALKSPLALRLARQAVYDGMRMSLQDVLDVEIENQMQCFRTDDAKSRIAAFLEKRRPPVKT
jgi:2-(1,2-epoxy-1,2-dihydrophenyl)acetyl-CoA isomerase